MTFDEQKEHQPSYRATFAQDSSAINYERRVYADRSSATILWKAEAPLLRKEAEAALRNRGATAYLDFACGTGRVLSYLEDLAGSATGIDISAAMLKLASEKCRRARLIQRDITVEKGPPTEQYDLITSFRFLTNAEPELRRLALLRLRQYLKDDGTLIVNAHGNPWSYRILLLPYHWFKDRFIHRRPLFGYLSGKQARELLEGCGFKIIKTVGMGYVPEKLLGIVPTALAGRIERKLAGNKWLTPVALNQMFVCVKK